jgi:hypothetical protein
MNHLESLEKNYFDDRVLGMVAELHRLHALKSERDELLAALRDCISFADDLRAAAALPRARLAIAKAEGEK